MKTYSRLFEKTIISIITVLIGITFIDCGGRGDIGLRYKMEKKLAAADKLAEQIRQKGKNISDLDLKTVIDAYEKISAMVQTPKDSSEAHEGSQELQQAWAISSLATTRIGVIYMDRKMYDRAYEYFKLVSQNPATTDIQKNAVTAYMALSREKVERYPEAAALYDTLAEDYLKVIAPNNPNMDALDAPLKAAHLWSKTGDSIGYLEKMNKAREYYGRLAEDYRGTLMESAAWGKRAASFIEQKRYPEAIESLRSVPLDTSGYTSPAILLMIADIYMNDLSDFSGAENTYREFVEHYPNHARTAAATLGIGLSLFEQGDYTRARKAVENIERVPRADQKSIAQADYLVGLCFEKLDKWELAKGQYEVVEASFPGMDESFEAALHVPDHYRISGKKDLAENAFKDAVDYITRQVHNNIADPVASARAQGYLVRAYTENGDLVEAAKQLETLHANYPQLPEGKLAPLRLADIYENTLRDPAKAVTWLKIFVYENPDADNIIEVKNHLEILEAHLANEK